MLPTWILTRPAWCACVSTVSCPPGKCGCALSVVLLLTRLRPSQVKRQGEGASAHQQQPAAVLAAAGPHPGGPHAAWGVCMHICKTPDLKVSHGRGKAPSAERAPQARGAQHTAASCGVGCARAAAAAGPQKKHAGLRAPAAACHPPTVACCMHAAATKTNRPITPNRGTGPESHGKLHTRGSQKLSWKLDRCGDRRPRVHCCGRHSRKQLGYIVKEGEGLVGGQCQITECGLRTGPFVRSCKIDKPSCMPPPAQASHHSHKT